MHPLPKYTVDLDAAPEDRWKQVVQDYKHLFPAVIQKAEADLREALGRFPAWLMGNLTCGVLRMASMLGGVMYKEELKAIAQQAGISLGKLIFMQLSYESAAACTSVLIPGSDGTIKHGRSMDWHLTELTDLTIEVEFVRGGEIQFVGTTWAGYVGLLTVMRPGCYSLSVNYRRNAKPSGLRNLWNAMTKCWPVGFLVRYCVEEEDYSFWECAEVLKITPLISPVFFTLGGVSQNEGVIIARDRKSVVHERCMESDSLPSGCGGMVQTNHDCGHSDCDNILWSYERWEVAEKWMLSQPPGGCCEKDLWTLLDMEFIRNEHTIYRNVMCAASGLYETKM